MRDLRPRRMGGELPLRGWSVNARWNDPFRIECTASGDPGTMLFLAETRGSVRMPTGPLLREGPPDQVAQSFGGRQRRFLGSVA